MYAVDGQEIRRPSEMALAGAASDRYAADRGGRDGVYADQGFGAKQADQDADAVYESVLRRSTKQAL